MKVVKYVWDSIVWESLIIDSVDDDLLHIFMKYLSSINKFGRVQKWINGQEKEWVIDYLTFQVNKKQAQVIKDKLLEMNMLLGVRPQAQAYFIQALADLELIIQGVEPKSHIQGIMIEYQEYSH